MYDDNCTTLNSHISDVFEDTCKSTNLIFYELQTVLDETKPKKNILHLGRRISLQCGDPLATTYLIQRLAVTVQRGNAASIIGTMGLLADWLPFLCVCVCFAPLLVSCWLFIGTICMIWSKKKTKKKKILHLLSATAQQKYNLLSDTMEKNSYHGNNFSSKILYN